MKRNFTQPEIEQFVAKLTENGFEGGMSLVVGKILPLAKMGNLSLFDAAKEFATSEEEDLLRTELRKALKKMT